jgi:hypothetical protein
MSSLRETIQQMIRGEIPTQAMLGTVLSVDRTKAVCDVQPAEAGAPVLYDVALRAVEGSGGFILWPKVKSFVLVGLVDNDPNHTYVAMVSEVDKLTLATGNENLHTLLTDMVAAVRGLKFTTNAGPTITLLTDAQWAAFTPRINNLLLP